MNIAVKVPDAPKAPNADEVLSAARESCNRSLSFLRMCRSSQIQTQHRKVSLVRLQFGDRWGQESTDDESGPWAAPEAREEDQEEDESAEEEGGQEDEDPSGEISMRSLGTGGVSRDSTRRQQQLESNERLPPLTPQGSERPGPCTRPASSRPAGAQKLVREASELPSASAAQGDAGQEPRWRGVFSLLRQSSRRRGPSATTPVLEADKAAANANTRGVDPRPGPDSGRGPGTIPGSGEPAKLSKLSIRFSAGGRPEEGATERGQPCQGGGAATGQDWPSPSGLPAGHSRREPESPEPLFRSDDSQPPPSPQQQQQQQHAAPAKPSRTAALLAMLEEEVDSSVSETNVFRPRQSILRSLVGIPRCAPADRHHSLDGARMAQSGSASSGGAATGQSSPYNCIVGGARTGTDLGDGTGSRRRRSAATSCTLPTAGDMEDAEGDDDNEKNGYTGDWPFLSLDCTTMMTSSVSPAPSPQGHLAASSSLLLSSAPGGFSAADLPSRAAMRSFSTCKAAGTLGALPGTPSHAVRDLRPMGQLGITCPGGGAGSAAAGGTSASPADSPLGSPSTPGTALRHMRKTLSCSARPDRDRDRDVAPSVAALARPPWRVSKGERQLPKQQRQQQQRPVMWEVRSLSLRRHLAPSTTGSAGSLAVTDGGWSGGGLGGYGGQAAASASLPVNSTGSGESRSGTRSLFGAGGASGSRRLSSNSVVPLTLRGSVSLRGARESSGN